MRAFQSLVILASAAALACQKPAAVAGNWADSLTNGRSHLLRLEKAGNFEAHFVGSVDGHIDDGQYALATGEGKTYIVRTYEALAGGKRVPRVDTLRATMNADGDVLHIEGTEFGTSAAPLAMKRISDEAMVALAAKARKTILESVAMKIGMQFR